MISPLSKRSTRADKYEYEQISTYLASNYRRAILDLYLDGI